MLHRLFGLVLGLIIFVVCATGALLTFEDEITTALNRDLIRTASSPLSADDLYLSVQEQLRPGERVARIHLPLGQVRVQSEGGRRELFFDPSDGTYLGLGNPFMSKVLELHRRLLISKPGRYLTLISALGMIFLSLTGLKLWCPLKRKKIRQSLTIKTTGSRRRLFLDLHRVGGVLAVLPFLLIALTGLNFSVVSRSYRSVIHTMLRTPEPPPPLVLIANSATITQPLERAKALAQERFPTAVLTSLDLPKDSTRSLTVRLRHPGQPGTFGRSTVEFHPSSGDLLRAVDAMQLPLGERLTSVWALPLHRGRAFGPVHQLLWFLIALVGIMLPMTGAWLWWNKGRSTNNSKGRPDRDLS